MAETAYVTTYRKPKKPKKTAMSGYGGGKKKVKQVKSRARSY
jgi:hypothetical protein